MSNVLKISHCQSMLKALPWDIRINHERSDKNFKMADDEEDCSGEIYDQ